MMIRCKCLILAFVLALAVYGLGEVRELNSVYAAFPLTAAPRRAVAADRSARLELVVQTGHSAHVNSISFSPDGKYIVSGSYDGTIKLWNVDTGEQLRAFETDGEEITAVAFSPDGNLVAGGGDDSLRIFEVKTGAEKRKFEDQRSIMSIAFSSDGKFIASGNAFRTVLIRNVESGGEIRRFEELPGTVESVSFSPDGKYVAGGSRLWELNTGTEVRVLSGRLSAFSPRGSYLATQSSNNSVTIWNTETGEQLQRFAGHSDYIGALTFSSDGRFLATGSNDKTIRVWDVGTGNETARFERDFTDVTSVALSPDGRFIAGAGRGNGNAVLVWDTKTRGLEKRLSGRAAGVDLVAFSKDGKVIASFNEDDTVRLWDTTAGALVSTLGSSTDRISTMALSPDGKSVARANSDNTIGLWSTEGGREIRRLNGHIDDVASLAFSPDGKRIVSSSRDQSVRLWDVETGRPIWAIKGDPAFAIKVSFSPNGKYILVGSGSDETVRIWNANTGAQIFRFEDLARATAFAPDSRSYASVGYNVLLWSTETGEEKRIDDGDYLRFRSVAFSPDGKYIAAAGRYIVFWDLTTGKEIRRSQGPSGWIESVVFSADGKYIITGSTDGTIRLWESATAQELAALVALGRDDWLVTTPEGYFDGTPTAFKQLLWRSDSDTFSYTPVETYFNDFFYPNLLQEVLAGRSPKPRAGQELENIDRRQPRLQITKINSPTLDNAKISIELNDNADPKKQSAHPTTSGARDLRLFRNGILVKVWHDDAFELGKNDGCEHVAVKKGEPRRVRCQIDVPLAAGENTFTAYAFNSHNVKSGDDSISIHGAENLRKQGTLYVLAIGINKYAKAGYDLNFAVADVTDISAALKTRQEKLAQDATLKQYARTTIVSLTDNDATKENIMLALRAFSKDAGAVPPRASAVTQELSKIKPANPEDGILIYYAGHGVALGDRFYLLPHDFKATDETGLASGGLSDVELSNLLESVDATRILMVIDACQSGQALGAASEGKAPMNSKGLAQLAYDKGMLILTAAQSQQAALEAVNIGGNEIRHGLLTYSLLDALSASAADKDGDSRLEDREWINYAATHVPKLQLEAMKQRHKDIQKGGRGSEIIYVKGDKNTDPARRKVQTPRVFYRREPDRDPLILSRF